MKHDNYKHLGWNPVKIPAGNWVRIYVSASGNHETWVDHDQQLLYQIICD